MDRSVGGWDAFINEDASDFVIMEDRWKAEYVAVGELWGMFSPPSLRNTKYAVEPNMVRLLITGVQRRSTVLPKPVVDGFGRVLCTNVGEAYDMKADVWWYESDTVLPNEHGCTHSAIYD
jgi:hypothetical protein